MILNVAKLPEGDSEFSLHDRPNYFDLSGDEFTLGGPVEFACRVRKMERRVIVRGTVRAAFQLPCCRCLEAYRHEVTAELIADFLPASQSAQEEVHELEQAELNCHTYRHDEVDLRQVVRDHLAIEIPMQPLCREGCAGLCPKCGVNRNLETCTCVPDSVDPRLAILQRFKTPQS